MTQPLPALKVGVAGVGVMGRNHARVLSDIRDFDLTAVFDPDAATADGVAGLYGARAFTTAGDFVAAGLDAAVVATPPAGQRIKLQTDAILDGLIRKLDPK